ncbi:MAG: hypothetical protein HFE46_05300 [Clostridia bacterium]|jgi:hypothetical protein|nr:hypothetical protein [Clostridia bacterium]
MKKSKVKIAAALLSASLVLSGAAACDKKDNDPAPPPPVQQEVLLSGFESNEELLSMIFSNMSARVEVSDEHVTSGEHSAKITMFGKLNSNKTHYSDSDFYILPGNRFLSKMDYSDVTKYSIDVYNASQKPYALTFGYNHLRMSSDMFVLGRRTLMPGANHLQFDVDNNVVRTFVDVTALKNFAFYVEGRDANDPAPVFYFDNFCATVKEHQSAAKEVGAVIDFSDDVDFGKFGEFGSASSYLRTPAFTKNTDLRYVFTGKTSMQIEFFARKDGQGVACPGFRTKDDMFKIPASVDLRKTYLTWRLYNATDEEITVNVQFFSHVESDYYHKTATVAPHSWAAEDNSILLQDIDDAFVGNGLGNLMCIGFEIDGLQTPGSKVYLDSIVLTENK